MSAKPAPPVDGSISVKVIPVVEKPVHAKLSSQAPKDLVKTTPLKQSKSSKTVKWVEENVNATVQNPYNPVGSILNPREEQTALVKPQQLLKSTDEND